MTTSDLDALLATADLGDRDDRMMLADAYEEAGRLEDAAVLRGEDAASLADVPDFATRVVQVTGYTEPDEFGSRLAYECETIVETDFSHHHESGSRRRGWEKLHPADRLWWREALAKLHDVEVDIANAPPHVRDYVAENRRDWECELEIRPDYLADLLEDARQNAVEADDE